MTDALRGNLSQGLLYLLDVKTHVLAFGELEDEGIHAGEPPHGPRDIQVAHEGGRPSMSLHGEGEAVAAHPRLQRSREGHEDQFTRLRAICAIGFPEERLRPLGRKHQS